MGLVNGGFNVLTQRFNSLKGKYFGYFFNTPISSQHPPTLVLKKEYVEWIITAKREETRKERLKGTVERLEKEWKNPRNI